MDLNELAIFIKVIDAGSFSGAAKALGLPRSTVSRKVSQLEESLGVRLLQRSTRKLNLTQAGRDYYLQCSDAISQIETANQFVTESQQTPSGVIRIAAILALQGGFLCEWVNEFLQMYPDVRAEILLSDESVDIIAEGVDVAIRAGALSDSSLVARPLMETALVLCASPSYLANASKITTTGDIKTHRCIVVGHAQKNARWTLENGRRKTVVPLQASIVVNSMEFAINACLAGNGIALLPDAIVREHFESKALCQVLEGYCSGRGGIYVVYPSRKHLSITVRTFVDFLDAKAGAARKLSR
ncbi:LysR family transcriptional regulator [Pseudomonadota bacterium]